MFNKETNITVSYVDRVLTQVHSRSECSIPRENLTVDLVDYALEDILLRLTASMWQENFTPTNHSTHVVVPCTWWDHFKQDCTPAWFQRLFPVHTRLETRWVDVSMAALYPDYVGIKDQPYTIVREVVTRNSNASSD
jgi:hypothetical protein